LSKRHPAATLDGILASKESTWTDMLKAEQARRSRLDWSAEIYLQTIAGQHFAGIAGMAERKHETGRCEVCGDPVGVPGAQFCSAFCRTSFKRGKRYVG
jgi:hypothetical protein